MKRRTVFTDRAGRYELRASSPGFFGVRLGVQFDKGIGHTDDIRRAQDLEAMGFVLRDTQAAGMGNAGEETPKSGGNGGGDA